MRVRELRWAGRSAVTSPNVLQIGSGKAFNVEWLNLDIDETW